MLDRDLQSLARETSSRVHVEDFPRLSDAMFSGISAVSADAIISVDDAHRITMFNEGAQSIFGYTPDEILGAPLNLLIPERFRAVHRQHIEKFAAGQQTARHMAARNARIYGLRKNGEEFPTDAAISKLDVGGKILLTVSVRDVSEQMRSEKEQRLLAEVGELLVSAGSDYQRLLNGVANVIVRNIADWSAVDIVQAGNVRRLRIVHADPAKAALCEALEHEPIDRERPNLISQTIKSRRPILVNDPPSSVVESFAHSGEHLQLLRQFDAKSLIIVPLVARGQVLGTLAFGSARNSQRYDARDVLMAEQLASRVAMAVDNARLHEALERAIRARDDVLGVVAHDLRNPLNAIMLRAQTLRRRGAEPDRRDQSAMVGILRSAKSMHRLIEDLLDVTRLEAGQSLSIQPGSLQTSTILAEVLERQQAAALASHRELCLDAKDPPDTVWADRSRLLQVFDNLVGNALKFSRKRITVGAGTRGDEALFWVADDGPGISAENLPRLFDRFWQASKTDRRGAGLGLSIAQGIVNAHGGRIWAESEVGAGATFYFTFPTAVPEPVR
jgi:PAS domain S-box-containing protein